MVGVCNYILRCSTVVYIFFWSFIVLCFFPFKYFEFMHTRLYFTYVLRYTYTNNKKIILSERELLKKMYITISKKHFSYTYITYKQLLFSVDMYIHLYVVSCWRWCVYVFIFCIFWMFLWYMVFMKNLMIFFAPFHNGNRIINTQGIWVWIEGEGVTV